MKILLGILAIIILIAIAVVGWLFVKRKQSSNLEEVTPSLPPMVQEALNRSSQTQPAPVAPSVDSLLQQADQLIATQRYDDATSELKRLLITNPKNAPVMLKLLQVYALTGNQNAFDQLHQTLLATGDQNSIQDAHTLQILLNDSIGANAPKPEAKPQTSNEVALDDTLSFDDLSDFGVDVEETPVPVATTKSANQNDEFAKLEFDDFGNDNALVAEADLEEEEVFDLSVFDEEETAPSQASPAPSADFSLDMVDDKADDKAPTLDLSADLADFNLQDDTPSVADDFALEDLQDKADTANAKADLDAFSLDNDLGLDLNAAEDLTVDFATQAQAQPQTAPTASDDFGLSLDSFDVPTAEVAQAPSQETKSFDFDLSLDDQPATKVSPVETANDGLDFGLDQDLSFDTPANNQPDNQANNIALDTGFADNIGFELDALNQTIESPKASLEPETLVTKLDDFQVDFGKSEVVPETPSETVVAQDELVGGIDFDDLSALVTPMPVAQPASDIVAPAATPVLSSMVNTASSLDSVEQFDNTQITLDLAKNYLHLGEHDSAKRLLQEVMQAGNAAQQQQAYALLNRLG